MNPRPLLLAALGVCLLGIGPFTKKKPAAEATPTEAQPTPPRVRIPPDIVDVWADDLPLLAGATPEGLGSLSAQSCGSCHIQAHDSWHGGAHAGSASAEPWRTVATEAADERCSSCHLPLQEQYASLDGQPNPNWSATLTTEGVTCASCHVRDGAVIVGRPGVKAPHPVKWSPQLGESAFCADCHQLSFAGGDKPLYDTFGEWQRSPQGQAGVTCQACHDGPGASGVQLGSDHGPAARAGRGLTLLTELATDRVIRGGDPLTGNLRLQNSGAGHHIPSGSPFSGLRVEASIRIDTDEEPWLSEPVLYDLARTLAGAPPYPTTADTRLAAGEERSVPMSIAVPVDAPAGPATLTVRVVRTVRGVATDEVVKSQELPLDLD
ncbi:MAG: hypothetical protein EP330_25290 [Deltaproteobacteria bacterium]|nr:MAG: hypothetical protein EP330_25290 [Deltaproteobacteria bacterium]